MRVVFRADASTAIGSGHAMRCLTLATRLRARGAAVGFVCRSLPGDALAWIEAQGFALRRLPGEGPLAWEADAERTLEAVAAQGGADWVVVDHYGLDARWETRLRAGRRLMVIDDLADRLHACDMLLDQNHHPEPAARYAGLVPPDCQLLLGPGHALLREAFSGATARPISAPVRRVLIFFGAADAANVTGQALDAVRRVPGAAWAVDVVLGRGHPHAAAIRAAAATMPGVVCHEHVADMAGLMAEADMFIGAGGTTSWERCCLGLPSVVISIADNQEALSRELALAGAQLYMGPAGTASTEAIAEALGVLSGQPLWREAQRRVGRSLVDGRGAERVAQALEGALIRLRPAGEADGERTFAWRNAEATRRFSFDPSELRREDHRRWFAAALADPSRRLLIGEWEGTPVGVLRYDLAGEEAVISVYLDPGQHGRGFGTALIRAGSEWLRREATEVRRVRAELRAENEASRRAFLKAGFVPVAHSFLQHLNPAEPLAAAAATHEERA